MALTNYQNEAADLLHDPSNNYWTAAQLTGYINRARLRISGRSQSVRLLLSGGTITAVAVNAPGSGYSGTVATIVVNGAGQQAQLTGTFSGGALSTVTLVNGGWGYVTGTTTTATVTDSLGVNGGATVTFTIDNSLTTVVAQEVYQFSTAQTLARNQTLLAGVDQIMGVFSVACAWGANAAMKPLLQPKIWTEFQAYFRSYNTGMQNFPTVWSQYSMGVNGSIYLWELPSQNSQMDWDCWCNPVALVTDATAEALSYPWTTPVPYYAAYLALLDAQRYEEAKAQKGEYDERMKEAVGMTTGPFVPDYYQSDF
jgi:hypothetical protein